MKEKTKKLLSIGTLSVVIVASLGFSVYTSSHMNDGEDKNNKPNQAEVEDGGKGEKEKEKEEPVIMNPLDGKEDVSLSVDKKDLTYIEIRNTEAQVRELYRQFEFEKGMEILNNLDEGNKLVGDAEVLRKLQFDGSLISNFSHSHGQNQEVNGLALFNLTKAFQDPESLLLATLYLDFELRQHVISYEGSLNPVYQEGKVPGIMGKSTEEVPYEVNILYPETKTFHKIKFSIEGNVLDAYINEAKDGSLLFYSIEDPYQKTHYLTIGQWKKIEDNNKKGLPAMTGVLEMEKPNSINTEEQKEEKQEINDSTVEKGKEIQSIDGK